MKSNNMLYLGLIIIAIGTFLIQRSSSNENSNRIKELEKVLTEKNNKISEQSEIINANITGGDSYCFLAITPISIEDYQVVLLHEGKYTIKNVVVAITDEHKRVEESIKLPKDGIPGKSIIEGINIFKKYTTEYKIGNMIANLDNNAKAGRYNTHLRTLNFKDKNIIYDWVISISADNGFFLQRFKSFTLDNGRRVMANQMKNAKGNILYESVSKDYPRNDKDELIW